VRGGELLQSLKQAGLSPEDIDAVFYTHLHPDHVGWTGHTVNGKHALTFPRARYVVRLRSQSGKSASSRGKPGKT